MYAIDGRFSVSVSKFFEIRSSRILKKVCFVIDGKRFIMSFWKLTVAGVTINQKKSQHFKSGLKQKWKLFSHLFSFAACGGNLLNNT